MLISRLRLLVGSLIGLLVGLLGLIGVIALAGAVGLLRLVGVVSLLSGLVGVVGLRGLPLALSKAWAGSGAAGGSGMVLKGFCWSVMGDTSCFEMSCCQYSPFSAPTPYESAFIVVRE